MVCKLKKIIIGNQTIYSKSSESMDELENNSINLIVTSPPYNIGKEYSVKGKSYNDNKNYSDYLDFLTRIFKECYRVLSEEGIFFLNIGDSAKYQGKSEDVVRCAVTAGFTRLQTIIWLKSIFGKGHYTPTGGNRRLNNLWEFIFVLVKSKEYKIDPKAIGIPYSDKSNIGRYSDIDLRDAGDIWFIPYTKTTGATIKKGHDAPFPIELPMRCMKLIPTAKTILDPFAGTASTLKAAEEMGLKGFGYEILPREEIIMKRFSEKVSTIADPLLPQVEYYAKTTNLLLEKSLSLLSESDRDKILSSLKISERRKYSWSVEDLGLKSIFKE